MTIVVLAVVMVAIVADSNSFFFGHSGGGSDSDNCYSNAVICNNDILCFHQVSKFIEDNF